MKISELYEKLSNDVALLEKKQKKLTNSVLKTDMAVLPRLYVRGSFYEFDEATQNLVVKTHGDTFYYPIECYDSEYLPVPGRQVLIYNTESGMRISGFEAKGFQIPPARKESLILRHVSIEHDSWDFSLPNEQILTLPLPSEFPEHFEFRLGASYTFRVIDSMPNRFYIFENIAQDIGYNSDLLGDIYHSLKSIN